MQEKVNSSLEHFLSWFPNKEVAHRIFEIIEGERIDIYLELFYPGLAEGISGQKLQELDKRPLFYSYEKKQAKVLEALVQYSLARTTKKIAESNLLDSELFKLYEKIISIAERAWNLESTVEDSARACAEIYILLDDFEQGFGSDENGIQSDSKSSENSESSTQNSSLPKEIGYRGKIIPEEVYNNQEGLRKKAKEINDILESKGISISNKEIMKEIWNGQKSVSDVVEKIQAIQSEKSKSGTGSGVDLSDLKEESELFKYQSDGSSHEHVTLREIRNPAESEEKALSIEEQSRVSITKFQRAFEKLKPQVLTRVRRESQGEEIDFDSAIDSFVEFQATGYYDDRVYIAQQRKQRDIFAGIILDSSGSTSRGVLDREKEAAFGLTHALEKIGDDYCLYAFCGETVYVLKSPNELFSERIRYRTAALNSAGGTPLGTVIRHATYRMLQVQCKTKLMLVLSDGLPNSVEDAQEAFKKSRISGIHSFLLAVEGITQKQAEEIAGKNNYFVFSSASHLAEGLPKLYRRLTI